MGWDFGMGLGSIDLWVQMCVCITWIGQKGEASEMVAPSGAGLGSNEGKIYLAVVMDWRGGWGTLY